MTEYLKKIEWDEANAQNKMNPYHAMTATCFWFLVCAEYYSYNFFAKKNSAEAAHEYMNRVIKMPVGIYSRVNKFTKNNELL